MRKLIPQVRFPEFSGEWEEKIFDEISEITRLAGYEYSKYWKEDIEGDIIALRGYNIGKGKIDLIKLSYISDELSMKLKRSRLYKGDIVYPCVGTIGNAVVIEESDKFHIQQNIAKISCKAMVSPYYIVQFLMSDFGMNEVYRFNASGAQPNVLVGSLRNYKVNLPSLPEQTKIANFLTAVDEKLTALNQKKTLLEQYKKGVMQQIFAQELRFKEDNGNDYADWEEKKLGELVTIMQSGISRMLSDTDIGLPIIRSNNIQNGGIDIDDMKYWYEIDNQGANLENYVLSEGDLLVNFINSIAQIGKVAIFSDVMKRKTIFTTNLMRLRFNEKVISNFMLNYFHLKKYEDFIQTITKPAVNQASFTTKDFKEFIIDLPSLPEQTKIANFLSAIDVKINHCQEQIDQTTIWKKGLLQQMFV